MTVSCLKRVVLSLAVGSGMVRAPAGTPGRLANPGFEGEPVKSVYFFSGNWRNGIRFYEFSPSDNTGLFTVHPSDSRHLGWSEKAEYRDFAVRRMEESGANVVAMSFWGPRGTDNWAYWAPMQTSTYSHDELFDAVGGRHLLIAPCLESAAATPNSPAFSFMDCFPGTEEDPAPTFRAWIGDLIDRYLIHPAHPAWPERWARMTDGTGAERYVVSVLHAVSNQPGVGDAAFAQGFERVADRIFSDTGIRIGFTLDVMPPGTNAPGLFRPTADRTGPELARAPSVLAVQCFLSEIWEGSDDESVLLDWKNRFASEWAGSGIPFIFDATPGYDAHVVFPNSSRYGNDETWWNGQLRIVRHVRPAGAVFNSWNGYTEGMAGMPTLQYGEANERRVKSLFRLADSLNGAASSVAADGPAPGTPGLAANFPNPFNSATVIRFGMPSAGRVKIDALDVRGRTVRHLVDGVRRPGEYDVRFDASGLPSGVYLIRMKTGNFRATRKVQLVK
jgi:hypothetical protein